MSLVIVTHRHDGDTRMHTHDDVPEFAGFPADTFQFLHELGLSNNREWFNAQRARYHASYVNPSLAFIAQFGPALRQIAPGAGYDPRVNGSLLRINRDTRFTRDKAPYKTLIDMWFWHGPHRNWEQPGFSIRISESTVFFSAGLQRFAKPQLDAFRYAVTGAAGAELDELIRDYQGRGTYNLDGQSLKKVPPGFDPAHERADLLRFTGMVLREETELPASVTTPAFVGFCVDRFRLHARLVRWLVEQLPEADGREAA